MIEYRIEFRMKGSTYYRSGGSFDQLVEAQQAVDDLRAVHLEARIVRVSEEVLDY